MSWCTDIKQWFSDVVSSISVSLSEETIECLYTTIELLSLCCLLNLLAKWYCFQFDCTRVAVLSMSWPHLEVDVLPGKLVWRLVGLGSGGGIMSCSPGLRAPGPPLSLCPCSSEAHSSQVWCYRLEAREVCHKYATESSLMSVIVNVSSGEVIPGLYQAPLVTWPTSYTPSAGPSRSVIWG